VYNYIARFQAFADEAFVKKLKEELSSFHGLYRDGNEQFIAVSDEAKILGKILRHYMFMPDELLAQAILNAHWRRVRECRKQRRSSEG